MTETRKNNRGGQNVGLHDFGVGEPMSIKAFRAAHASGLSVGVIRDHIAAGRTTARAMLTYDGRAAVVAGARRGAAAGRARGFMGRRV